MTFFLSLVHKAFHPRIVWHHWKLW